MTTIAVQGQGRHPGPLPRPFTVAYYGMSKMYALAQVSGLESNLSSAAARHGGTF
jgi:hypothetical protein